MKTNNETGRVAEQAVNVSEDERRALESIDWSVSDEQLEQRFRVRTGVRAGDGNGGNGTGC